MTEKLYDIDAYLSEFTATVRETGEDGSRFYALLDRTAFFPEEGGQYADTGRIGDARVLDVQIKGGELYHYTDKPLAAGTTYDCAVDFDIRFRKMQNHSGEHIVSGLVHSVFGLDNVGFHLGTADVTIDYNGFLTREQIREIEYLANKAVAENVAITAEYPDGERLAKMEYRSKLELTENVRIVTVEGYDICACCAPHVRRTGEIGIIKLLDAIHYKGGVRIHMLCGFDALEDYNKKYDNIAEIGLLLSAKQHETAAAVSGLWNDYTALRREYDGLKLKLIAYKASSVPETKGNICVFDEGLSNLEMREYVNMLMEKCAVAAVFSRGESGYSYVAGSKTADMRALSADMRDKLCARGGGRDTMIQGSTTADESSIREYFGV